MISRQYLDLISFTRKNGKQVYIINKERIETIETNENGKVLINGEEIDQSLRQVFDLFDSWASIFVDTLFLPKKRKEE